MEKKSILTSHAIVSQTPPSTGLPKVGWDVEKFNGLIYNHGYHAFIEHAMRCPCVDKATGQALSTCKNCLGRGWLFINKQETRVVSQSMNNLKRDTQTGEVNRGTARITVRAVDRVGFMDRIMLTELEAYYTEIVRPQMFDRKFIAYPVYEPIEITDIFLYVSDQKKLMPLTHNRYKIVGNRIEFDKDIIDWVEVTDVNQTSPEVSVTIRYSYHPVYHIVDANRELMRVSPKGCRYDDEKLAQMPINVLARKAHYIFDAQRFDAELYDNTVKND